MTNPAMRSGWIDAHNHLHDIRPGEIESVIEMMKAAGISCCMANATREEDWPQVRRLAEKHPGFVVPAYGIHPWHAHTASEGWESRLLKVLKDEPAAGIGECGLDGWVKEPGQAQQKEVFLGHLRIAEQLLLLENRPRPFTIHCLKAWAALFDAFSEVAPPPGFLMHSFGGSLEIARRLLPLEACFSFSGHFLHEKKAAVLEMFRQLPKERILLETDAPDMTPPDEWISHKLENGANHPANLPHIGKGLAEALGIPVEELRQWTAENARRFSPALAQAQGDG